MPIEPFDFKGHAVRVIADDPDNPLWVASDVAKILGYSATAAMTRSLDPDEKGVQIVHTLGGDQEMTVITEAGLYNAILKSRVPAAHEFKRWVTHEVLPAIRRDGGYVDPYADEHQLKALMFQCRSQMELAQAAKGLIHPDHLEAKARIILARGMGEAPELDPQTRPLYTQAFLKEKGLSKKQLQAKGGVFGKRMKRAYIDAHGREPQKYPLELSNGQVREVNGYTEADRPLMQQVWRDYFEEVRA